METIQTSENNAGDNAPKRPTFLLILCILTLINSGYMFCYYLLLPMMKSSFTYTIDAMQALFAFDSTMQAQVQQLIAFIVQVPNWKFMLTACTYLPAIVGAVYMLKLNKVGFHLYVVGQILTFVCVNFLIGGMLKMPVSGILWTLIFIFFYFNQLRKAKVL